MYTCNVTETVTDTANLLNSQILSSGENLFSIALTQVCVCGGEGVVDIFIIIHKKYFLPKFRVSIKQKHSLTDTIIYVTEHNTYAIKSTVKFL